MTCSQKRGRKANSKAPRLESSSIQNSTPCVIRAEFGQSSLVDSLLGRVFLCCYLSLFLDPHGSNVPLGATKFPLFDAEDFHYFVAKVIDHFDRDPA